MKGEQQRLLREAEYFKERGGIDQGVKNRPSSPHPGAEREVDCAAGKAYV